jgi:bleomycin hydrolase
MKYSFIISKIKILCFVIWAFSFSACLYCNDTISSVHVKSFNNKVKLKTANVKNQYRSNTCWAFASIAFIESELMREKNIDVDLSEMFVVRMGYIEKARRYVRMQGKASFSNGGSLPDVFFIIKKYGILPTSAYRGIPSNLKYPDHKAFDSTLVVYIDSLIQTKKRFVNNWEEGFIRILDKQLGKIPDNFVWENKTYTPIDFANKLGISYSNYVFISSLKANPFYEESVPEFPDNWLWSKAINVPWCDMENTIISGIKKGYTCGLCCDISEKGFVINSGLAEYEDPLQMSVIDSLRQADINNFKTTDEHAMQACGLAEDSIKNQYIIFKNSWGDKITPYKDLVYMSLPYLRMKTISIIINKKGIPAEILSKFKSCN